MKQLELTLTRGYSLHVIEFWHTLLSERIKDEFGSGLDQIFYFTGRNGGCYRVKAEFESVKESVLSKSLDEYLFSDERTALFHTQIDQLRSLFKMSLPTDEKELFTHVQAIYDMFTAMYPQYMLALFLPNRWREEFLQRHPTGAPLLERLFQNRIYSEGMFDHLNAYCRSVLIHLGVSEQFLHVIRFQELFNLLHGGVLPSAEVLQRRVQGFIAYKEELLVDVPWHTFMQAHDFQYTDTALSNIHEFSGIVACPGPVVRASIQIILNPREVSSFQKGNILVTTMTSPEYVAAIKIASAVITDEGGITCHAAISSRELGTPCVIGTKFATKVLKDGDMVEVDANRGFVKILT